MMGTRNELDPYNTARIHALSVLASGNEQDKTIVFHADAMPEIPEG